MKTNLKHNFQLNQLPIRSLKILLITGFVLIAHLSHALEIRDKENELNLFKIERNRNSDEIKYNVRITDDGTINNKKPLHVFWQINTKVSKIKSLTFVQKKYGYGIKILQELPDEIHFSIAAIPTRTFVVRAVGNNHYKAFCNFNNCEVAVNSIYISFVENTNWVPEISFIKFNGTEIETNKEFIKIIRP